MLNLTSVDKKLVPLEQKLDISDYFYLRNETRDR
jgi:hypothetical protein